MMRSKDPFSSAGSLRAFSKSYGTNSLNTAKRSSYSSSTMCGLHLYSPDAYLKVSILDVSMVER
jgi:hypothetical protein